MLTEADLQARSRTENFTVASRLLPKVARQHLLAFYAYARLVDEVGDSFAGDRSAALDEIERQLDSVLSESGGTGVAPAVAGSARSVRALGTDPTPLFDLITANRQDQSVHTYQSFDELLGYCALSANPVGRLVLAAFGSATPQQTQWSDSICSGLQLAEHWQDVKEDARAGRVYLPQEDLDRFGVDRAQLTAPPPAGRELRALMVFEVARARRLLDEGKPLIRSLRGRARWAVAGYWAGGQAALDAIARHDFDVLYGSPRPSRSRTAALAIRALTDRVPRMEAA
jgi:squalene synthase HpnC